MSRWQHQWLRSLRWYDRTANAWGQGNGPIVVDDAEDFVFATWQAIWHVADYVNHDPEARAAIPDLREDEEAKVERLVKGDDALDLIRDLANVTKHSRLTQRWEHDHLFVGGAGHGGWRRADGTHSIETFYLYIRLPEAKPPGVSGLLAAYEGLHAWRARFKEWNMQWDARQPGAPWPEWGEPPRNRPR